MAYDLKAHIAAQNAFVEAVGDDAYFNDFIAARDPNKGFIFAEEPVEQEEEDVEEFDDYD